MEKAGSMSNFNDFIGSFIKGPGWFPGTPRLGDPSGVPEAPKRNKYNPASELWIKIYAICHFSLVYFAWHDLNKFNLEMPYLSVLAICIYLTWTLTSIGLLFDSHPKAFLCEFLRIATFFMLQSIHGSASWENYPVSDFILSMIYGISLLVISLNTVRNKIKVQ